MDTCRLPWWLGLRYGSIVAELVLAIEVVAIAEVLVLAIAEGRELAIVAVGFSIGEQRVGSSGWLAVVRGEQRYHRSGSSGISRGQLRLEIERRLERKVRQRKVLRRSPV